MKVFLLCLMMYLMFLPRLLVAESQIDCFLDESP